MKIPELNTHEQDEAAVYILPNPALNLYWGWALFVILYLAIIGYGLPFFALKAFVLFGAERYLKFEFFEHLMVVMKLYLFAVLSVFFQSATFGIKGLKSIRQNSLVVNKVASISNYLISIALILLLLFFPTFLAFLTYSSDHMILSESDNIIKFSIAQDQVLDLPKTSNIIGLTILAGSLYLVLLPAYQLIPLSVILFLQVRFWKIG